MADCTVKTTTEVTLKLSGEETEALRYVINEFYHHNQPRLNQTTPEEDLRWAFIGNIRDSMIDGMRGTR